MFMCCSKTTFRNIIGPFRLCSPATQLTSDWTVQFCDENPPSKWVANQHNSVRAQFSVVTKCQIPWAEDGTVGCQGWRLPEVPSVDLCRTHCDPWQCPLLRQAAAAAGCHGTLSMACQTCPSNLQDEAFLLLVHSSSVPSCE